MGTGQMAKKNERSESKHRESDCGAVQADNGRRDAGRTARYLRAHV